MAGPVGSSTTYQYCVNCTEGITGVTVTLQNTACNIVEDGYNGDEYVYRETVQLQVTIPSAITCDLTVRIQRDYNYSYYGGGSASGTVTDYLNLIIPAGSTSVLSSTMDCTYILTADQYGNNDTYDYYLADQSIIPSCSQAEGCTIEITGSTTTSPSILGASDGSITVYISGATGSSYTFRLDGGTPQSSATFTGLPSGTYQVRVDEGGCYSQIEVTIVNGSFNTQPFTVIEPSSLLASENPIMLTISTAIFDGTSTTSKTSLIISSGITNNYKMVVTLSSPVSYTTTLHAKSFPNKANYFLANTLTDSQGNFIKNNNNNEIADSLAQCLLDDIIISNNYYINVSSNIVTLVAKQNSSRFDITSSNVTRYNSSNTIVSTGVTVTVIQNGSDFYEGDILDNYNIYAEIYGSKTPIQYGTTLSTSQFDRQTELQLPYQRSNIIKFDMSEICKSFVYTPKPDYEFTGFTTLTTYMQPFFFKYGEVYPLVANTNTKKKRTKGSTDFVWVCNAALNYENANVMTGYTGTTISGFLRNVPYLTNSPIFKQSTSLQRELLYFIVPQNLNQGTIDVRGDITFWDGTTLPNQTFITITTSAINFGGVFVINVSKNILGLNTIESSYNKIIKEVVIRVYSGGGSRTLTAAKYYRYDIEQNPNRIGISWLNKLGTFDTFDFYGLIEEGLNRSSKSYTVVRDINVDGSLNKGFKYNSTYDTAVTKKVNVNSGWINAETFNWLLELLASNEIYIYSNINDNYVNVTGFKYSKSSNDTLYNIELELTYTIQENNVSI